MIEKSGKGGKSVAQKLKNLRVTKVDFVDEGANPRADIKLYKRKEAKESAVQVPVDEAVLTDSVIKRIADALSGAFKGKAKVEKGEATSFKEQMNEVSIEKIRDEIWSVCYALQTSLGSIVSEKELEADEMRSMLEESIEDFYTSIKGYASIWAAGDSVNIKKQFDTPEDTELPMLMQACQNIEALIEKARVQKGELEEMLKIDKTKMTPEDRIAYEEIVQKYAAKEEMLEKEKTLPAEEAEEIDEEEETEKKKPGCKKSVTQPSLEDDIYKGLHPAVKAEMEALRKFREDAETRELTEVAKKYEIIGKKPAELVPTLKKLRTAGGSAYEDMLGILDSMVATVQEAGVFGEIGKSRGNEDVSGVEALAKVRTQAAEIRKSRPELTEAQAMDEAFLAHPELIHEFDK